MSNILFLRMQFETCNLKDFRLIILAVMVKQLRISYAYSSALPNRRFFFFFSVILQILFHMLTWMLDARQEKEQTWWPVFSQLINLLIIKLVKAGDYFFLSGKYRVLWKIHVLPYTKCVITVFWILL